MPDKNREKCPMCNSETRLLRDFVAENPEFEDARICSNPDCDWYDIGE